MILPIVSAVWQIAAETRRVLNFAFGNAPRLAYIQGVAGNCVSNALPQRLHRDTLPLLRGPFFCRTGPFFLSRFAMIIPATPACARRRRSA